MKLNKKIDDVLDNFHVVRHILIQRIGYHQRIYSRERRSINSNHSTYWSFNM